MRVIAGSLRSRTLSIPRTATFRPTTDRVRESVFNILASRLDLDNAEICDLFAGSGSLGIEALSRGAARTTFVEQSHASLQVLKNNLETLDLLQHSVVSQQRVETFIESAGKRFDLIFADPPYGYDRWEPLLETIVRRNLLSRSGLIVFEHSENDTISATEWLHMERREFGSTAVSFFNLRREEKPYSQKTACSQNATRSLETLS